MLIAVASYPLLETIPYPIMRVSCHTGALRSCKQNFWILNAWAMSLILISLHHFFSTHAGRAEDFTRSSAWECRALNPTDSSVFPMDTCSLLNMEYKNEPYHTENDPIYLRTSHLIDLQWHPASYLRSQFTSSSNFCTYNLHGGRAGL